MINYIQEQIDQHNQNREYTTIDFDNLASLLQRYNATPEEKNSDIQMPVDFLLDLLDAAYSNGYSHGASW